MYLSPHLQITMIQGGELDQEERGAEYAAVEATIRQCLQDEPAMQHVIIELLLKERGILEVAQEMALSARQVVVLREAGLQRLRACRTWHLLWENMEGTGDEES